MQSMPGELIEIDGLKIHYEKVGTGPNALLLLPGGIGTTRTDFDIQLSEDKGLNRKLFTIVAWDPPGHGFSRPPARVYDKDVYKRDADLAAKLMEKLGFKFYSLIGWSAGGRTALIMAINYGSRIDKLVVWGCSTYLLPHEKLRMKTCKNTDLWDSQTRDIYEKVYGNEAKQIWGNLCDYYINVFVDTYKNEVHKILCPTLVLYGELDPLPKEHPIFLANQIGDSRLYRFPKGGHTIHQEFSDEFNKVVTDFLLEETVY